MLEMTPKLAYAAAHDAANRQMRAAGRNTWSEDDYGLACDTYRAIAVAHGWAPEGDA